MIDKMCRTCKYWNATDERHQVWASCLRLRLMYEGDIYPEQSFFIRVESTGAELITQATHFCCEWRETKRLVP